MSVTDDIATYVMGITTTKDEITTDDIDKAVANYSWRLCKEVQQKLKDMGVVVVIGDGS